MAAHKRATNADLLEVLERIEQLMLLIHKQLLLDRLSTPTTPAPVTYGYRCAGCGQWVTGYHVCTGYSPNTCKGDSATVPFPQEAVAGHTHWQVAC